MKKNYGVSIFVVPIESDEETNQIGNTITEFIVRLDPIIAKENKLAPGDAIQLINPKRNLIY